MEEAKNIALVAHDNSKKDLPVTDDYESYIKRIVESD